MECRPGVELALEALSRGHRCQGSSNADKAGRLRARASGNKRSLSLERFRLLARFHLGRIAFRLRILFSFQLLLTNPRQYFANIWAVSTKGFRDHPDDQFGLFRQYAPREPIAEKFPRIRTASHQLPGIALVTPSYQQGRYLGVHNSKHPCAGLSQAGVRGGGRWFGR